MPNELTFLAAMLVGLLGSTHCLGMCGGIVSTLSMGLSDPTRQSKSSLFFHLLAYNAGRISSYTFIGAISALLGSSIAQLAPTGLPLGKIITALFLIALGLYLANWWRALTWLERLGLLLWRRIEPFGRRWLPVHNPLQAFGLGIIWGWLPCGLVYTAVAWSLTTGNWQQGALLMFGFGLGTLPVLLVMGSTASSLRLILKRQSVRTASGIAIILLGIYTAYSGFATHAHHQETYVSTEKKSFLNNCHKSL
jgi:sulfite exporter TauE/SafE